MADMKGNGKIHREEAKQLSKIWTAAENFCKELNKINQSLYLEKNIRRWKMELAKCAVVAVFLYFILKLILSQKTKTQNKEREERKPLPVEGAYKKRWLLTYNEKDAY